MVLPIRQKPVRTYQVGTPARRYDRQESWVQKAPFTLPLQYQRHIGTYEQDKTSNYYAEAPFHADTLPTYGYAQNLMDLTNNKAYEHFKGKVYGQAALGVDFAEAHQSLAMIARSCETLALVARDIRRGKFMEAAFTLGEHFVPPRASLRKSFANNFLEFHFGWEPLVRDIYDALEVVNDPIKTFESARGSSKSKYFVPNNRINFGSVSSYTTYTYQYRSIQGGRVQAITSGIAHTLDQFGLINPAVIAWELVPFSFVVDWFVNVGDVLASYSDFAGITLTDTYTTNIFTVAAFGHTALNPGFPPVAGYGPLSYYGSGMWMKRGLGLTLPTFSVKRLRLPSKVRAVTAWALLTQQLTKK